MALFTGAVHGDMSGAFTGVRRYLFETIPHIIPWGRLTKVETILWQMKAYCIKKKIQTITYYEYLKSLEG